MTKTSTPAPSTSPKIAGKRRMAREMALQMLYQQEMGGSTEPQIYRVFDRIPYLSGAWQEEGEPREDDAEIPVEAVPEGEAGERRRTLVDDAFSYAKELVSGTLGAQEEIDALIRRQADNWRLERMPAVDRNILRLAIYELLYQEEIPKLVVVDEAIELAKRFSTEQSSRFVNGLLDGLLKVQKFPGSMT